MCPQARCALRRADVRRGVEHHQHAARPRHHRLHPRAQRGEGADHRPDVRGRGRAGAESTRAQDPRHRRRRAALCRTGRAAGGNGVRRLPEEGRREIRMEAAGERVRPDRVELHLGHHRAAEGVVYHHRGTFRRRWGTSSPGRCRRNPSICGPGRCFTATAAQHAHVRAGGTAAEVSSPGTHHDPQEGHHHFGRGEHLIG